MLIVVYIMKSSGYEGWVKRKFILWEDFFGFDLKEKIVVYIDNIFDGYIYWYLLKKWWDIFCYFYFNFIKDNDFICFLIIVKDNVIENVCVYIKVNVFVFKKFFFVEEEFFFFIIEEMICIIDM